MKRLLLAGGGHAHLAVLREFARERPPSLRAVLVTPHPQAVYSGMVPGVIAGHYRAAEAQIALEPLARAAGVEWRAGRVVGLDAGAHRAMLEDGSALDYDVASLDTGSLAGLDRLPGAAAHALATRPVEALPAAVDALFARDRLHVAVVGGGAAGFELAAAIAYRIERSKAMRGQVSLVAGRAGLLANYPPAVGRHAQRALRRLGITLFEDDAAAVEPGQLGLAGGSRLATDAVLLAGGPAAPTWLRHSGLELDALGFVATGPTLQSRSHPDVFAAGDVATRTDAPHPRSGVHAVRAGPPLALNLRRALAGGALVPYMPQRRTLNLLSCGSRRAILAWGDWVAEGAWVWWWKDRIDRRFIAANVPPGPRR
jgi:selenide,water dikinase